ncbi:MAG: hypothetical protein BWK76_01365 [Desulfobulbaceae bacterium A2]|nr:MAG: hypothetical protein BWK76_01365 [Desulfobulbaceae bacterium A2]
MRYYADLHIHSRYSRATSPACDIPSLAAWAQVKGIDVLATGDFTHPRWFAHLRECLVEAEPGFLRLRDGLLPDFSSCPPGLTVPERAVRFVLCTEISSIYKRGGRTRKVHNLILLPDFSSAARLNSRLAAIGNIEADGRPILGLDSRNLLEILLSQAPEGFLIPAHIWTPWFSLFGSKSGFDAIEECFADLSPHIFALETGLSSDPAMNRLVSALDRFTLISNSDCHSPGKIGREVNLFETGFDFFSLREAIRTPYRDGRQQMLATIEFYPEEGKYHCDGHRKCNLCCEPAETRAWHGICPRCGSPLTVGVLSRVMELADRAAPRFPAGAPAVQHLIPLQEVLGELLGQGPETGRVRQAYGRLLARLGPELAILHELPLDELQAGGGELLAEAVRRLRQGEVRRQPGYDGEFGVIRVFEEAELAGKAGQLALFAPPARGAGRKKTAAPTAVPSAPLPVVPVRGIVTGLNARQAAVVASTARHILVQAGPGTGKTHTLVQRLCRVLAESTLPCTVITFTNRAADELRRRLADQVPAATDRLFVGTFHGYCLHWLRRFNPLKVAGPEQRRWFLLRLRPELGRTALEELSQGLGRRYAALGNDRVAPQLAGDDESTFRRYDAALAAEGLIDLDEIIPRLLRLLDDDGEAAHEIRQGTGLLAVDEFQDVNAAQYALVCCLAASSPLFAIGDPDQAIYSFRGADPAFFFRCIEELAPELHVLTRNYRCGRTIMAVAAELVAGNDGDGQALARPSAAEDNGPGRVLRFSAQDGVAEAAFVVETIESLLGGTSHRRIERLPGSAAASPAGDRAFRDFAVLYRMGWQGEAVAECLSRAGLPYQMVDVTPFFLTGQARSLHDFLQAAARPEEYCRHVALLAREPELGLARIRQLELTLPLSGEDFFADAGRACGVVPGLERGLRVLSRSLGELRDNARDLGMAEALARLARTLQLDVSREELRRLLELADACGLGLTDFAEHLTRSADSVVYDQQAEAVTLATLHAAKGLEFSVVFILGLEEGILPLVRGQEQDEAPAHIAEERRLFYVGMTRAQDSLYLVTAARRLRHGTWQTQSPSRFFAELPTALVSEAPRPRPLRRAGGRQLKLF